MHNDVAAEYERMVVNRSNGGRTCSSYVSEDSLASRIGADALEVEIMKWRLRILVECRALPLAVIKLFSC